MAPGQESRTTQALLAAFPGISVIAVGEMIGRISAILDQMAAAIVAAGSITILAGIAVLIGAITASRQARSYDSVVLKMLGATRGQSLATQALEYGLLAAVLAFVSLALGTAAAWFVIVQIFEFAWAPDWTLVIMTLAGGVFLTLGIGLAGSLPLMSVRSATALRQL
jgi:putative ABC transport system permease protein